MKIKLFGALLVLSMLAAFTGTVFAAPSAVEPAVELLSAHAGMNGTVFQFRVSGEFSRAELHGTAVVQGGESYSLDCRQLDDETVRCSTSLKVQGNVTVTFGGSTFWTFINPFTKYCYNILEWNFNNWTAASDYWAIAGQRCQGYPAQEGQKISFYSPAWGNTYNYAFLLDSPTCTPGFTPSSEDAFYMYLC